jgi:hypothetical protein
MCGEERVSGPGERCKDGSSPRFLGIQNRTTGEPEKAKQYRNLVKPPEYVQKNVALAQADMGALGGLGGGMGMPQDPSASGMVPMEKRKKRKNYISEEIKMLTDPDIEMSKDFDNNDVESSANDLAIDG